MDDLLHWIALARIRGLGRDQKARLLELWGSPAAVFEHATPRSEHAWGVEALPVLEGGPDLEAAARELDAVGKLGLEILIRGRPGFPRALEEMPDAPLLLYARGVLPEGPALAMVGSRRPSSRSRHLARALAAELASDGVVIVSGLAYGIDAACHEGALSAGGKTVTVLASGLERARPVGNRGLARRILASGGAWLSEYPPGQQYQQHHYPERNRLISGLARATLVVEARERSGSLVTAKHALAQGRSLGTVPGPVDSDLCRGSNTLLRDAVPILDADDLRVLAGVVALPKEIRPAGRGEASEGLPERVLAALADGPLGLDPLVRRLELPAERLAGVLLELELAGRIAREGARVVLKR